MKKVTYFAILILFFLTFVSVDAYNKSCNDYRSNVDFYSSLYSKCSDLYDEVFEQWYEAYETWEYKEALNFFEAALKYVPESDAVSTNISLSLWWIADIEFDKWNYIEASRYYDSVVYNDYEDLYTIYIKLSECYFYIDGSTYSKRTIEALNKAENYAETQDKLDSIEWYRNYFQWLEKAPTNDTYSWAQYYLHTMNIPEAWDKISNSNEVIVAVIDDGIYLNHPDLKNKIWEDDSLAYWESRVINFIDDWLDNLAAWEHGTMVSWIIAADKNNYEWIAWIAENVKIMPLRVFDIEENTKEWWIIEALNYAIDNEANIINLSLWQSQFKYNTDYDEVIKRAYDNNIIVVIAAWNGDVLSKWSVGIDLTENPIAPVCNNWWNYNKFSIWVHASDVSGWRTNWTNHWNCAPFMAPWENIVSTSVPFHNDTYWNDYNSLNWTSFSAPIISWIIALWFNQYWEVPPDVVYDSLVDSLVENTVWNYIIDASLYLDQLSNYYSEEDKSNEYEILKNKYKKDFTNKIWDKLSKFPKTTFEKLLLRINVLLQETLDEDLKARLEALKEILIDNI